MFLDTWFPTQGKLESYPHIELTSCQHWNPLKIDFPQKQYSVQKEEEGRNFLKVTICFFGETPGDTDRPLDGYDRGNFRSHKEEVVVHAGMEKLHRCLVADIAVTATRVLAILTVNRDKKHEISLAVSSKDKTSRDDRMAAQIVSDITSEENTTQQAYFADE